MAEDFYASSAPAPRGVSLKAVLGTSLLAFAGGAALIGYLVWDGRLQLNTKDGAPTEESSSFATLPGPSASPSATPAASPSPSEAALAQGGMDQRIAALEQRLARLDLQAAASEGNTARAEALLIAFAARRAVERGAPLGYLADQLKLRFADAQGNAVRTVIDTAAQPVTLDQLSAKLEELAPSLGSAPANESGWARFKREVSGLFVVRRGDTPSSRPENRLERARLLLRSGQVEAALAEVGQMPGSAAANGWIAQARRYADAQRALDLIEMTALQDPGKLKGSTGQAVQQPSPVSASPSPTPTPGTAVGDDGTF